MKTLIKQESSLLEKKFNIKDILCKDIPLEWEESFTLLGLDIDNKLEKLDCNFDKVHSKTLTLINDWKARRIPLEGRINISKCLLVSQYMYIASIMTLNEDQILTAQTAINNYIMDSNLGQKTGSAKTRSINM